jgi:hypothetical protein
MDIFAQVNVGTSIVEGTIIPPNVDDFALIASTLFISRHPKFSANVIVLNANLAGAIDLNAGLTGSISASQRLYQVAIPGLDFPG